MNMSREMGEGHRGNAVESREKLSWELTVALHRHGPKVGQTGPLTELGKEQVSDYYDDAYEGIAVDDDVTVDIVHSPIHRAEQTAALEAASIRRRGGKVNSISVDDRLNEGALSRYEELMQQLGGGKGKWLNGWMALKERPMPDVKTGKEAAADVAQWLLELIEKRKATGGAQEVEAVSHFPVLAAFLMRLEELSQLHVLPDDWMERSPAWSHLDLLRHITFHVDDKSPTMLTLFFSGKSTQVPISFLEDMAGYGMRESEELAAK